MFEAVVLTPETATAAQRLSLGHLLSERYARTWPEEPPLVPELEAQTILTPPADAWRCTWAVWDPAVDDAAAALAWAQLQGSQTHNTHWAGLILLTHPDHEAARGDALRRALWAVVTADAQARGVSVIGTWGVDRSPEVLAFLQKVGFRQTLTNAAVRLEMQAVPGTLLDAWTARLDTDSYHLHRWTRVPDEYLERVASVQGVINDMPTGDSELGELVYTAQGVRDREAQVAAEGETRFLVAVEDTRTGELVAYSETYWGPERAALVYQGATAVRPAHRGQCLGRRVKAEMLRWLHVAAPGAAYIKTTVAEENDAMNALNRALGFRPYAVTSEWERRLADRDGGLAKKA